MNSLVNKMKLIETTKLNKYCDTEVHGLGSSPWCAVPQEQAQFS
jgi:hypothetical protein